MKKATLILNFIVLLLAVVVGGFGLYIVNTPKYALKKIIEDVNDSGIESLNPHLTDKAKETLDIVSSVTKSDLFSTIMGSINQNNYIGVLKSKKYNRELMKNISFTFPLWIDLNIALFDFSHYTISIYIPLWIDLNSLSQSESKNCKHLHSTMDRFKYPPSMVAKITQAHLHSTMDRFKLKNIYIYDLKIYHLHSTMDRFKYKNCKIKSKQTSFTFHYG